MCQLYKANSLLESLCGLRNLQRKMDDWDPGLESRFMFRASTSQLFSLSGSHPEAFLVATERSEVACVVCARKDWLENRFTFYLWSEATGSST